MTDLMRALAEPNQPEATYAALAALVDETIGVKLFTTMEIDRERSVARRGFTNIPGAFPTSGGEPMREDAWSGQVHDRHTTFVAISL